MKRLTTFLLLCAACLFSVSCNNSGYPYKAQTPPASAYHRPVSAPILKAETKRVEIISEPARARIEINDNYVGDAPITVEIPQNDGYFKTTTTIRALPTEAGDYTQAKFFFGNTTGVSYGAKIPSRILFDMHLGPVTPSVEVNVNP